MNVLKQISDDISMLQCSIPEDLFKIKNKLNEIAILSDKDVKNHPFVMNLLDKNRSLRKKIHKLEQQLLNVLLQKNTSQISLEPEGRVKQRTKINELDQFISTCSIKKEKNECIVIEDDDDIVSIPSTNDHKKSVEIKIENQKENITLPVEEDKELLFTCTNSKKNVELECSTKKSNEEILPVEEYDINVEKIAELEQEVEEVEEEEVEKAKKELEDLDKEIKSLL